MRRVTVGILAAVLALPASAVAASEHGVVLSVDSRHKTAEVVDGSHVVHAYKYRGHLPRLQIGSRVTFKRSGKAISSVKAGSASSGRVAFYGRVARSSRTSLVLRLADGKTVSFSSKQVRRQRPKPLQWHKRHARVALIKATPAGLTINIQALEPSLVVLITETVDDQGDVTITIAFPPHSDPVARGEHQASGTVTDVGSTSTTASRAPARSRTASATQATPGHAI
jgi:hypothetical protein